MRALVFCRPRAGRRKGRLISEALEGGGVAVAAGMTLDNVAAFLPYFTHYLVGTGVWRNTHHFDETQLAQSVRKGSRYASE